MINFKSNGPSLIGLISLLLMVAFVCYFLKKEYEDEKAAMVLEARDKIFVSIFSDIEHKAELLDSGSNELKKLNLKYTSDSIDLNVDVKFELDDEDRLNSRHLELSQSHSYNIDNDSLEVTHFHRDTLMVNPGFSVRNKSSFPHIIHEGTNKNMFSILNSNNPSGSFFETNRKVDNAELIKRLIPQFLFSFLLLFSTALAYFLFSRQLRKERELTELRNDFISNMSHELKTPVSTISVALEALKNFNAADNKEMRSEYIDISKHEVDRLGLLVDKALNISLFEQGKYVYNNQIINLDSELESVLKILKVQLDNKQVELEYEKTGESFSIEADKTHIVNVVHNLIENAIKYSDDDPYIDIKLKELTDGIELSISDNGLGIAPQYQDKIFDKFFRVPQGNTHNTKGHGLGLSYVKEVVDKHNGTIKLKSGIGAGTTFIIHFPKMK